MSEMVEQVALALEPKCRAFGRGDMPMQVAREFARAAIEALREPNSKMINAAAKAMSPEKRPTQEWVSCGQKHKIRYQAMIDEALK